jgi:cell division protease FtsH
MDKPYSEHTAETIDQEISKIIEKQYERAIEMLENNREKLDQLANLLLEKEVIFKENVEEIFGKRPWDKEEEKKEEKVEEAAASTETDSAINVEEPASIEATVEESIEDTNKVTPSVEADTSSDIAASKEE